MNSEYNKIANLVFAGNIDLAKQLITASELDTDSMARLLSEEFLSNKICDLETMLGVVFNRYKAVQHCSIMSADFTVDSDLVFRVIEIIEIGDREWRISADGKHMSYTELFKHVLTTEPSK